MEREKLNIVQVTDNNIDDFVSVISNVKKWLDDNNIYLEGWEHENITREKILLNLQKGKNMYIGYIDNIPVSTMALQEYDFEFWGENSKNENAIYVHRLSVLREFSGKRLSHRLLDFAKEFAIKNSITKLRLDCKNKSKLRKVYEDYGFKFIRIGTYGNTLYELII